MSRLYRRKWHTGWWLALILLTNATTAFFSYNQTENKPPPNNYPHSSSASVRLPISRAYVYSDGEGVWLEFTIITPSSPKTYLIKTGNVKLLEDKSRINTVADFMMPEMYYGRDTLPQAAILVPPALFGDWQKALAWEGPSYQTRPIILK